VTASRARVGWWTLVIAMVLGTLAATTIGLRHTIEARQTADAPQTIEAPPAMDADSAEARQIVLDTVNSAVLKMLSYTPENVETTLNEAKAMLASPFRESYGELIQNTVIPGAKEKKITATCHVAGAAVESLTQDKASLLVFVNQQVTVPPAEPTDTASSVRVGMKKINGDWLIDAFDPV
jgi:Mce-associated membrane protein